MPELPEVETVTRGLNASILGGTVFDLNFFRDSLRDQIPIADLRAILLDQPIIQILRRAKYIVMVSPKGAALIHLGMTGNLLLFPSSTPQLPHTHVVIGMKCKGRKGPLYLHFVDPRRFGRLACHLGTEWQGHPLLRSLGVEPLTCKNLGDVLFRCSRGRSVAVKTMIMDAKVVVGVGNIYASESLFSAGIHPGRDGNSLAPDECQRLATAIKTILRKAIRAGGTTLQDYRNLEGKSGYFSISLNVYGRAGELCRQCATAVVLLRQSGRSTFYCPLCQKEK